MTKHAAEFLRVPLQFIPSRLHLNSSRSAYVSSDAQAQVRVTLQASGAVEAVSIYHTAGNVLLDREALRAARQSTYRAEVRDCVSVRGDYLFTVDFRG